MQSFDNVSSLCFAYSHNHGSLLYDLAFSMPGDFFKLSYLTQYNNVILNFCPLFEYYSYKQILR